MTKATATETTAEPDPTALLAPSLHSAAPEMSASDWREWADRESWLVNHVPYIGAGGPTGQTSLVVARSRRTGEVKAWLGGRLLAHPLPADIAACAPLISRQFIDKE